MLNDGKNCSTYAVSLYKGCSYLDSIRAPDLGSLSMGSLSLPVTFNPTSKLKQRSQMFPKGVLYV